MKEKTTTATAGEDGGNKDKGEQDPLLVLKQKDLMLAGEAEVAKLRGGNYELMQKLFT